MSRLSLLIAGIAVATLTGCRSSCDYGLCKPTPSVFSRFNGCFTCNAPQFSVPSFSAPSLPHWPLFERTVCRSCRSGDHSSSAALVLGKRVGCVDSVVSKYHAWSSANKALSRYRSWTGERLSADFKAGFQRAYQDIADGYSGQTPAVPPKEYWTTFYRTAAGRECVNQWFAGYEAGANAAREDGFDDLSTIASNGSIACPTYDTAGALPSMDGIMMWSDPNSPMTSPVMPWQSTSIVPSATAQAMAVPPAPASGPNHFGHVPPGSMSISP